MTIQKIRSGRIPSIDANVYVGEIGTIFYNEDLGDLRLSDGQTPGGTKILENSGGTTLPTNEVGYLYNDGSGDLSWSSTTTSYGDANVAAYIGSHSSSTYIDRGTDSNDWNSITTMGVYLVNRTSWSGTSNTPINSQNFTGQLEVINTSNVSITQNYRPYDSINGKDVYWTRSLYGSNSWTPWVEIINGAEVMDGGSF